VLWGIDQICFDPQLAYSRPELAIYMRRPGSFTLVAESIAEPRDGNSGAKIVGFIVAEVRRRNAHIITIDVIPNSRRAGIGSSLLLAAEEQANRAGATVVELETAVNNLGAIQFYKTKGYFVERTVSGYYSNSLDALVMRKELVPLPALSSL
jgi:ribosomal protein S18 acetylase RimI-like enzyme